MANKKAAKKKTDKPKHGEPGHNVNQAERNKLINTAHKKIDTFDDEIRAAQDRKKAWKNENIKGKLGMKIADFDASHRLYKLDPDDRDQFLATIKETFEALGVGEQLNWLKAEERAEKRAKEAAAAEAASADSEEVTEAPARLN